MAKLLDIDTPLLSGDVHNVNFTSLSPSYDDFTPLGGDVLVGILTSTRTSSCIVRLHSENKEEKKKRDDEEEE